jgi:hypothetical protein
MSKIYVVYNKDDEVVSAGVSRYEAWNNLLRHYHDPLKGYFEHVDKLGHYTDEVEV